MLFHIPQPHLSDGLQSFVEAGQVFRMTLCHDVWLKLPTKETVELLKILFSKIVYSSLCASDSCSNNWLGEHLAVCVRSLLMMDISNA